ncbi:LysR family transcriptional regulator [Kitasatospora sp. GAS204B]|uniref:LysR family transcriptional regulator n=1 Tax=unclassified Kitasatospora TaxID=2633591 RepID=UPI002473FCB3|nr:LysR family transcriptional regulator [Kitasatospora sp. GAS204B]MDH6118466.1 DNA-binding transcriptional LysR family regulator [Kitasatospora sp. GAS204B]
MFDLRQLQMLAEVARTGTYTAAADALGYSQPAVSYQMRMLERTVGAALVTRSGRGIRLTEVGQTLARHAETVLAALRTAQDEVATLTSSGGGQVRLAAMQSGCVALVPAALGALRRSHPELEVVVTQTECPVSHGLVLGGEVELAMMCDLELDQLDGQSVSPDPRLLRLPLLSDRRCVLLPADHPLAAAPTVALDELAGERWVLESGRERFLAACQEAGFTPKVAATSDDQLTIHCLVANRIGVAIMNELGVGAHSDPRVVARPLRDWPSRRIFALLWPDMARVAPVAALLDSLRAAAQAHQRRSVAGGVRVGV